jgi:enamine deaminase RidA (YjgF/YER057c/UK114 family)
MNIERWRGSGPGRSHTVAWGGLVWTVSNARNPASNPAGDLATQVAETLALLEQSLHEAGSGKTRLLSVQVLLASIDDRAAFDRLWCEWIGDDPAHWPQRAVYGATLAPGLRVELLVTAARTGGAAAEASPLT